MMSNKVVPEVQSNSKSSKLEKLRNGIGTRSINGVALVEGKVDDTATFPIATFLFLSLIFFVSVTLVGHFQEQWDFVTSFYFAITTLTTVGYGDVSPKTEVGRLLIALLIIYAVVLISWGIAIVFGLLAEIFGQLKRGRGKTDRQFFVGADASKVIKRRISQLLGLAVFFVTLGVLFLTLSLEFTFIDSFYFVIVTVTTVGYGDIDVATSDSVRIALSLYILFSYAIVGKIIGLCVELIIENKKRALRKKILHRRMSCEEIHQADADGSGELGESEFVLFKVQQMELVNQKDLYDIKKQFWALDTDGNGSVSVAEAMAGEK